jgi:hypothetical protein
MGKEIVMLVHCAALEGDIGPQRRQRLFKALRAGMPVTSSIRA